jgi:hypothetical protein
MKAYDKDESSEDNEEYSEDVSFDEDSDKIKKKEKEVVLKPEFFSPKYKISGCAKNDRLFQSLEEPYSG